uniref:Uncharacterized protein n=1 Tax=Oryctolagus cuniculus TaxID=9986 RepID=G1TLL0_RABIT
MMLQPPTSTSSVSTRMCLLKGQRGTSNGSMIMQGKGNGHLKRYQGKKLSPSQKQCWDNKRLLVSFLYLQSLLQLQWKFKAARFIALCQLVLEDFRLCLSYPPCPSDSSQVPTEGKPSRGCLFLPDILILHMVVLCLMNEHSLRKIDWRRHRLAVFFLWTLSSHLIQQVSTRIQAKLQKGRLTPDTTISSDGIQKKETGEGQQDVPAPCPSLLHSKPQDSCRQSCVSGKSCVSEVRFHSCSNSDETDEGKNTFFSPQVHPETSSDPSCSDSTDEEGNGALHPEAGQERRPPSKYKDACPRDKWKACEPPACLLDLLKTTIPANLPTPPSLKLQGKQSLPLAPVFIHGVLMPQSEPSPVSSGTSGTKGDMRSLLETEPPAGSYRGQKASIGQAGNNLQTIQRKLKILSAEGLLPTIQVILGWLRTNHSLLTTCWRNPLSLWEDICVLLNLLPSVEALQEPGLGLSRHLQDLVQSCTSTENPRFPQLPEDIVLCQCAPLQVSQGRLGLKQEPLPLNSQDEAVVYTCFLRSFGHFVTRLPGRFLRFDSKLGIFVNTASEGPESSSHQLPRVTFSKDIAQRWLQCEVMYLEKTLRSPQTQSVLAAYLFPDPRALCNHLPVIKQLAASGEFFLIIPRIVVDILYVLRKKYSRASAAVTFLENELKRGNQYILC